MCSTLQPDWHSQPNLSILACLAQRLNLSTQLTYLDWLAQLIWLNRLNKPNQLAQPDRSCCLDQLFQVDQANQSVTRTQPYTISLVHSIGSTRLARSISALVRIQLLDLTSLSSPLCVLGSSSNTLRHDFEVSIILQEVMGRYFNQKE